MSCRNYREDLCIFDASKEAAIMMSSCVFHAGRCRGDPLYFMNNGPCKTDAFSLDWAKFRARVSEQSSVQEPCGADTCYEWETCSGIDLIMKKLCLYVEYCFSLSIFIIKSKQHVALIIIIFFLSIK